MFVARMFSAAALALAVFLFGCASKPTTPLLTPGSRLIFHNGTESVWSICDRVGNTSARIFLASGGGLFVIPGACPTGEP